MRIPVFTAAVGCCGVLVVAGCGGGSSKKSSSAPATTPAAPAQTQAPAAAGGAKAATIGEKEFSLTPATANVGSGAVTLTAQNTGTGHKQAGMKGTVVVK